MWTSSSYVGDSRRQLKIESTAIRASSSETAAYSHLRQATLEISVITSFAFYEESRFYRTISQRQRMRVCASSRTSLQSLLIYPKRAVDLFAYRKELLDG